MYKLRKPNLLVNILALHFVLISTFNYADCRRLSFKDSLTAYAEKTSSETETNIEKTTKQPPENVGSTTKTSWPSSINVQQGQRNGGTMRINYSHQNRDSGSVRNPASLKETTTNNGNQLSLWGLTKMFPFNFGARKKVTTDGSVPRSQQNRNMAYFTKPNNSSQALNDSVTENVAVKFFNKTPEREKTLNTSRSDGNTKDPNQQKRDKKEIASAYGLSGLMWNTATALWSVNREHFLPTFLHTKTGGKLSLIRDSFFKPVNILSQFRNGVQEINNEKLRSLARLSTPTGGWGRPVPQVFVVKLQPENSRLLTLARYIFRLTKHTAVTKLKLKRALLDLQIRAARRLVRIITSKNVAQKIAAVRILTNAIWKGKRALLRIFTGPTETTTTPSPYGPYPGVDNSVNVDITYSSLNNHNNQQWMNFVPPAREIPQPPPPPPPTTFTNYYAPSSPVHQSLPVPNTLFVPPAPPQKSFPRTDYPLQALGLPTPVYQSISPTSIPLIEQPSYAHLLKEMGIHPGNYDSQDYAQTNNNPVTSKTVVSSIEITSPKTTVVYYYSDSDTKNSHIYNGTSLSNTIEAPAISYSYHSTFSQEPTSLKETIKSFEKDRENKISSFSYDARPATPPPPTSFRFKILEAMGVAASKNQ